VLLTHCNTAYRLYLRGQLLSLWLADKTGTLTEGKLKLSSTALVPGAAAAAASLLQPSSNGNGAAAAVAGGDAAELLLLRLAAAVEASTRHPLAAALAAEAAARGIKLPPVSDARTEPGAGAAQGKLTALSMLWLYQRWCRECMIVAGIGCTWQQPRRVSKSTGATHCQLHCMLQAHWATSK
jgi:cation transport ATPase